MRKKTPTQAQALEALRQIQQILREQNTVVPNLLISCEPLWLKLKNELDEFIQARPQNSQPLTSQYVDKLLTTINNHDVVSGALCKSKVRKIKNFFNHLQQTTTQKNTLQNNYNFNGNNTININQNVNSVITNNPPRSTKTVDSNQFNFLIWHLPHKPENFTGRKKLLQQLNQLLSKQLIKNAPVLLSACHGLGGVGKSYLALKFSYDRLMSNCKIQQQTNQPSEQQKQSILSGNLLLIVKDHAQNKLQLAFCDASTYTYCQKPICNKAILAQLAELPDNSQIIDPETRQNIFNYAKVCNATPHYKHIFWFSAQNKERLRNDYLTLAKELGFRPVEPSVQIQNIKYWLAQQVDCLLIYDNAQSPDTIDSFLPKTGPHIIITSRYSLWPKAKVKSLNVGVFTHAESLEFIKKMLGNQRGDNQSMIELSETLGNLPLALTQACSYLTVKTTESIRCYLKNYKKNKKHYLLQPIANQLTESSLHVFITWKMTRYKLEQESKLAKQLLEYFACVHHQTIPYKWCLKLVILDKVNKKIEKEKAKQKLDQALACLKKYSLIQWQPTAHKNNSLNIHILLQEVIRIQTSTEQLTTRLNQAIMAIQALLPNYEDRTLTAMAFKKIILPHVECLWTNAQEYILTKLAKLFDTESNDFCNIYWLLVCLQACYEVTGDYLKRQHILEELLKLEKKLYGNNIQLANTYRYLGNVAIKLSDPKKAEVYYQKALTLLKAYYGDNHPKLAKIYLVLGNVAGKLSNPKQAQSHYQHALELYKKQPEVNDLGLANVNNNLGNIAWMLGNLEEANLYYQQALTYFKKFYKGNNSEFAATFNNLGAVALNLGNLKNAKSYFERALELDKKRYGNSHPQLATSYLGLGNVALQLGQLEQATDYFQNALMLDKKLYGNSHPELALAYNGLGNVALDLSHLKKAKHYFQLALTLQKKRYNDNHFELAGTYNNLGALALESGKFKEAITYFQQALSFKKKHYGNEHSNLASTYNNLGEATRKLGNLQRAKRYCEYALKLYKKRYNNNHPGLAFVYNNLGFVEQELGHLKKASEYLQCALELLTKRYGKKHRKLATTYVGLGIIALHKNQLKQANSHLQYALTLYKNNQVKNYCELANTYNNLGVVAAKLGDHKKARTYYQEAIRLYKKIYGEEHLSIFLTMINLSELEKVTSNVKTAFLIVNRTYQKLCEHPDAGPNHPYTKLAKKSLDHTKISYSKKYLSDYPTPTQQKNYFLNQARTLNKTGINHYKTQKYSQAIAAFQEALGYLRLISPTNQPEQEEIASVLYNMGSAYLNSEKPSLAKHWLEKCLNVKQNKLQQSGQSLNKVRQKIIQADQQLTQRTISLQLFAHTKLSEKQDESSINIQLNH